MSLILLIAIAFLPYAYIIPERRTLLKVQYDTIKMNISWLQLPNYTRLETYRTTL